MKQIFLFIALIFSGHVIGQNYFHMEKIWEEEVFPNNPYMVEFDQRGEPFFYVANDQGGLLIYYFDLDASFVDPMLVHSLSIDQWENMKVMKVTQRDTYLYLALGSFFDGPDTDYGLAIVDINDPENAVLVDYWKSPTPKKGSAIVKLQGDYAYLGAMNDGVQILDVSDPNNITHITGIIPDPNFPVNNPSSSQEPNARGMAIQGDYLYLCYDAGGISVIDISDPHAPSIVSRYINEPLLGVTQQAYNNIFILNDLAYVATDFCGMEILDISDPTNLVRIGWWNPWECQSLNNVWINSPGHTNEIQMVNVFPDYVFMNANDQEMVIVDVHNKSEPFLDSSYGTLEDNVRTWGFGIKDEKIVAAYYFTLLPWLSLEAKLVMLDLTYLIGSTDQVNKLSTRLSPNPVYSNEKVTITSSEKIRSLELLDVNGLQLYSERYPIPTIQCDITAPLFPGMYFLRIFHSDKVATRPIVVH